MSLLTAVGYFALDACGNHILQAFNQSGHSVALEASHGWAPNDKYIKQKLWTFSGVADTTVLETEAEHAEPEILRETRTRFVAPSAVRLPRAKRHNNHLTSSLLSNFISSNQTSEWVSIINPNYFYR
jgi:hypothetical protein